MNTFLGFNALLSAVKNGKKRKIDALVKRIANEPVIHYKNYAGVIYQLLQLQAPQPAWILLRRLRREQAAQGAVRDALSYFINYYSTQNEPIEAWKTLKEFKQLVSAIKEFSNAF